MFDTAILTIAGNVVADPRVTGDADSPDRVTFRVVSNRRQRDLQTGEWKQVGEYGMNVVCWRKLARGVAQALRKGDPVLVQGRVAERKYIGTDNEPHWRTELTAEFVGHDLAQGYAKRFTRFTQLDRSDSGSDAADGSAVTDVSGFGEVAERDGAGVEGADGTFAPTGDFDDITAADFDRPEAVAAPF